MFRTLRDGRSGKPACSSVRLASAAGGKSTFREAKPREGKGARLTGKPKAYRTGGRQAAVEVSYSAYSSGSRFLALSLLLILHPSSFIPR